MDFKNYVRMMLEADKAKDQDEERAEDQDDSDEDEDEDSDEDEDEEQASVETKNGCTGSEASMKTKNGCAGSKASCNTDEDEDEDEDNEDEKCPDCGKSPCECKKKNLKEAMIYSARYGEKQNVMTEETRVLVEGIENNSASKYLAKLAKKAEKSAAKYGKKNAPEAAEISKKAAATLKEASNKLYKCETRYQAGDVSAKREYKKLCKQYSSELKAISKKKIPIKGLLATIVAGVLMLGAIGVTTQANADLSEKINSAMNLFKDGNIKDGMNRLGDIKTANEEYIKNVFNNNTLPEIGEKITKKATEQIDGIKSSGRNAIDRVKDEIENVKNTAKSAGKTLGDAGNAFKEQLKKGAKDNLGLTI